MDVKGIQYLSMRLNQALETNQYAYKCFGNKFYHMVEKITNWKIRIVSLFRANYGGSFYMREMAKMLGTTHVTLIPHLRDLTKDKILVSKLNGRSRGYSLNLDNILAKDYVIIAEKFQTNEYLEKTFLMRRIYVEIFKISLEGSVVLFGSYVKGYKTEESDIDMLYLGDIDETLMEQMRGAGRLYGKQINVKKTRLKAFEAGLRSGDALTKEVLKDHIILQDPDLFVNAVWRYYAKAR